MNNTPDNNTNIPAGNNKRSSPLLKVLPIAVLAAVLVFARYHVVSDKQFGGITGDLAGWFLQKAELYMLAALVFCQWKGFL